MRVLDLFRLGHDTRVIASRSGLPEHEVLKRLHIQRCEELNVPCQILRRGIVVTLTTQRAA